MKLNILYTINVQKKNGMHNFTSQLIWINRYKSIKQTIHVHTVCFSKHIIILFVIL
jgi:hypothetical protein